MRVDEVLSELQTKNDGEDEYGSKCGTSLKETAEKDRPRTPPTSYNECFGQTMVISHVSIIIGVILIFSELSVIMDLNFGSIFGQHYCTNWIAVHIP